MKISEHFYFEKYKQIFGEREDDIYIVTYPKSGTTLMQMILYQLTTDGNMDFSHIYDVSPWIRNASYLKREPVNLESPRIIKSHDFYNSFGKKTKGRFIFVFRDGMDVAVSLYHQNKSYNKANLTFEESLDKFLETKSWFKHSKHWLRNKKRFPILFVRYEDLLKNKEKEIHRIIDFCKFTVDKSTFNRTLERSSFEFMKQYESKFGEQPPETKPVFNQFIRKGKAGESKVEMTNKQMREFNRQYIKSVEKDEIITFKK